MDHHALPPDPTHPKRRRLVAAALAVALAAGAGCSMPFGRKPPPPPAAPPPLPLPPPPPPPPQPVPAVGQVAASADLNPSESQRPSPLALRVYELRSGAAFGKADFMSLYQADQSTLAGELVARDELVVAPGERRAYTRLLAVDTRFVAVFGAYRDVERSVWRAIVPVPPGEGPRSLRLEIRAGRNALALTLEP